MKQVVSSLFLVFALFLPFSTLAASSAADKSVAQDQVNINSGDAETISLVLKGVGFAKAQAIVAWRERNGDFTSVEQLIEVKGIGKKLVDKNRGKILLQ